MAKDITREELLEELCNALTGDMLPVQPGEFPLKEIARAMGIHPSTLHRRVEDGKIPDGWEVITRRGNNGQVTQCFRKATGALQIIKK